MKTQTQSNLVDQKLQDLLSVQNLKVGLMFLTSVWGLGGFFIGQFYPLCSLSACFKGLVYGSIFSCLNPSNLSELHIWFNEYVYIILSNHQVIHEIVHYASQQYFTWFNYNRLYFLFEIFWLEYVKKVNKYHP